MSRMSRAFTRLISSVVTVSLAGAALTIGGPTLAAGDHTVLYIDGEPLSVGMGADGKSFTIFDSADYDVTGHHDGAGWEFEVARVLFREAAGTVGEYGTWNASFGAPLGTELAPGTYTGAVRTMSRDSSQPGLDVSGNGEGCNTLTGEFVIHEIEWDVGVLYSLSASFRQRCDGNPARGDTYGEVRFNATTGVKALEARPWSVDFGQSDSGTPAGTQDVTVKAIGDRPVDLGAASIVGAGASSFSITSNACSGSTLNPGQSCVIRVSAAPSTNKILQATLRLVDDTYRGRREVPLKVKGLGSVDATAEVNTSKFFPVVDQYMDTLAVRGSRTEATRVDVEITRDGSSGVIATGTVPMATGDYQWIWRGKVDATGELAPAGKYDVVTTLTAGLDTKTVTKTVTLSHDWVTWQKKTAAKDGRRIALWGWDKDGTVSFNKSIFANGVRLDSGRGLAVVIYVLPVAKSDVYGWMSFEVEGKSANKHKAAIAVWNPLLGGHTDLSHYDAARKIGPWEKWWKTGVMGQGRVKTGKVRLAVMVWKGLGGSGKSVFDIDRARVVYRAGTVHKAPGPAIAAPAAPARVVSPKIKMISPQRLPSLTPAPKYVPPPVLPDEPSVAGEDPGATSDVTPGPTVEPIDGPEAKPTPDSPPVDEPAPTAPLEPLAEPSPTPEPIDKAAS